MSGLLIDGKLHQVPDVTVLSPGQQPWVGIDRRDSCPRSTRWVRQITLHTTKGIATQSVKAGRGAGGKAKSVADYWRNDPNHSGAHIIVDNDGTVACLADLVNTVTYHATTVNGWSVGIEMFQEADGGIYEAVIDSTVKVVLALCDRLGIPLQGEARPYVPNGILQRLKDGGKDAVGVFGHRDNAWDFNKNVSTRGRGDPGDIIFMRLRDKGMLLHKYDASPRGTDLDYWAKVQSTLNQKYGEKLGTDGVCGPSTVAALRKYGLWNGGVFREMLVP